MYFSIFWGIIGWKLNLRIDPRKINITIKDSNAQVFYSEFFLTFSNLCKCGGTHFHLWKFISWGYDFHTQAIAKTVKTVLWNKLGKRMKFLCLFHIQTNKHTEWEPSLNHLTKWLWSFCNCSECFRKNQDLQQNSVMIFTAVTLILLLMRKRELNTLFLIKRLRTSSISKEKHLTQRQT